MSVLINARIWHEGIRLDTEMTAIQSEYGVEEQDNARFNDATRRQDGALKTLSVGYEGFFKAGEGELDEALFGDVGGETVVSAAPNEGAVGETAYFSKFLFASFEHGGTVGEQHQFSGGAVGRGSPLLRGPVLHNGTETGDGQESAVNEGQVGEDQNLYAVLHVLESAGDGSQTLDVTIESDSADDFTGAETTRITFPQVGTDSQGLWATPVAGEITDDWWRAAWTIGGTGSPSFEFAVAMAIL